MKTKQKTDESLTLVVAPCLGDKIVHANVTGWTLIADEGPARLRVAHGDGSRTVYNWQHVLSVHESAQ